MAGIYIHIPFCKQACTYCDFHFSTSTQFKTSLVEALCLEIELRQQELNAQKIETVYLGGGSPSILSKNELQLIIEALDKSYDLTHCKEFTLEANPDDLSKDYLSFLRNETPINRLSIGVQSYHDDDLQFMNRAHNSEEAHRAISFASTLGFEMSIDLIYGFPNLTHDKWKQNIQLTLDYGVEHISAYQLTVEPKTVLAHQVKKGIVKIPKDQQFVEQYNLLVDSLIQSDFEHYEISNFAKNQKYALHNTNYWKGIHYQGIGPSAHSYNGKNRRWNVANNQLYLKQLKPKGSYYETEIIDTQARYNETVLTLLRTMWGIDENSLKKFPAAIQEHFQIEISKWLKTGEVVHHKNTYTLSKSGKLIADGIASDLFWVG